MLSHQHPLVLLPRLLRSVFLFLVPLVAYVFFPAGYLVGGLALICIFLGLSNAWRAYHAWDNTVLLLTNERLIVTRQHHVFDRDMVECNLYNVQQVNHRVKGMLSTLAGYGSLTIHTAGTMEPIEIANIPEIYQVEQVIQEAVSVAVASS